MSDDIDSADIQPEIFANRRYKLALSAAVVLFLALITITVLLIILANAQQEDLEANFDLTMTAIHEDLHITLEALTPPPGGPYALSADLPVYSAAESCDVQVLTGTIRDSDDTPVDGLSVQVWGDTLPHQALDSGDAAGMDPGAWTLTLDSSVDRRVYVQITDGERYVSAPVEIALRADDCAENMVLIAFTQVTPLD